MRSNNAPFGPLTDAQWRKLTLDSARRKPGRLRLRLRSAPRRRLQGRTGRRRRSLADMGRRPLSDAALARRTVRRPAARRRRGDDGSAGRRRSSSNSRASAMRRSCSSATIRSDVGSAGEEPSPCRPHPSRRDARPCRPLLHLRDIGLTLGGEPLLEKAELSISPGDRIALVGRNGSGKSTLLRIAAGQLAPDRGHAISAADGAARLPAAGAGHVGLRDRARLRAGRARRA